MKKSVRKDLDSKLNFKIKHEVSRDLLKHHLKRKKDASFMFFVIGIIVAIIFLVFAIFLVQKISFGNKTGGLPTCGAFGCGTVASPYQITNCTQLQDIQNNLTANYILINNIDC